MNKIFFIIFLFFVKSIFLQYFQCFYYDDDVYECNPPIDPLNPDTKSHFSYSRKEIEDYMNSLKPPNNGWEYFYLFVKDLLKNLKDLSPTPSNKQKNKIYFYE